jgi:saposin
MNARELRFALLSGKDANAACSLVGFCGPAAVSHGRLSTAPTAIFSDVCEDLVSYIRKLVLEGFSKEQIEPLTADFCSLLPPGLSPHCRSLIAHSLDQIIAGDINRFDVCRAPRPLFKSDGPFCDTCTSMVDYVEVLILAGYTPDAIATIMDAACGDLGEVADLCRGFVNTYIYQICEWLNEDMSSAEICSLLGLCGSNPSAARAKRAKSARGLPSGALCDGCKDVIILIREMLINGAAKETIEAAVAAMCATLGPFAPLCTSYIDQYIDEIFAWIDQGLDENQICGMIGLCSAQGRKLARRAIGVRIGRRDEICDLCKSGIDYVRDLLVDGYAKEEIEELLNAACNELPAPFSSLCVTYVDQFIDQIFDWIDQELDSEAICSLIGLCSSQSPKRAIRSQKHLTTIPAGVFCDACQAIVQYIEKLVIDGFAEAEIEQLVADLCGDLPSPISGFCIAILDLEIENIIAWIDAGIEAFDICERLGICDDVAQKMPKTAWKREALSPCARNPVLCAPKPRRPLVKVQ